MRPYSSLAVAGNGKSAILKDLTREIGGGIGFLEVLRPASGTFSSPFSCAARCCTACLRIPKCDSDG